MSDYTITFASLSSESWPEAASLGLTENFTDSSARVATVVSSEMRDQICLVVAQTTARELEAISALAQTAGLTLERVYIADRAGSQSNIGHRDFLRPS